jgi:hypothetical protein
VQTLRVKVDATSLVETFKEAASKLQSQYLPGGTEENHENTQGSRSPDRNLNPRLLEYEAEMPTTGLRTFDYAWIRMMECKCDGSH